MISKVYPGIPVDNFMLCKRLGIKPKIEPCSDKVGPPMTGRITECGFGLSTVPFNDEMILQQAEKLGIQHDFTCMKFGSASIFDVTHNLYRPMIEAAGKGFLNI
ncbi:MAG: hypothetical protein IMF05_15645 [Proteobacteria bacterium]|nr:hypothetical protein [Pseudomonadota bacterium]